MNDLVELPSAAGSPLADRVTILVIAKEPFVRAIVRMLLEHSGYRVLDADREAFGIALYREHVSRVRAIVCDLRPAVVNDVDLIRELRAINHDARIVAISGANGNAALVAGESGRLTFLAKPISGFELANAVRSILV
jgi:CheY-like chemotaxis protein